MDIICAIIDAQGFVINNKFYPREIAVTYNGMILNFDVNTNLDFRLMNEKDVKTNEYIMNNVTGLKLRHDPSVDSIPMIKLGVTIAQIYEMLKTPTKQHFGIKNSQFSQILDELGIPYKEIDTPSIHTLMKYYNYKNECNRHTEASNGMCATVKVAHLDQWIKDKESTKNFIRNKFICI